MPAWHPPRQLKDDTMPTPMPAENAEFAAIMRAAEALFLTHPDAAPVLCDAMTNLTQTTTYPALTAEEVTDDGETYPALRCPWCDGLVSEDEDEGLTVVDVSERWTRVSPDEYDHERHTIDPYYDSYGNYHGLYYLHGACGQPVDLPEGWKEN